jgi:hypothetical protein
LETEVRVQRFRVRGQGFQHESLEAEVTVKRSVQIVTMNGSAAGLDHRQLPDDVSKPVFKSNTERCL